MMKTVAGCILIIFGASLLWATYSIVAWDGVDMGVAVQSHWFSVGSVVTWAEAGVGCVATQSFAKVDYGPLGLFLMKTGFSPKDALESLLLKDQEKEMRQVAMVNARGEVAVFTGRGCLPYAGHVQGDHFSCQGNIMATPRVWKAMAQAFSSSHGPLAERLLKALQAGESAGGDLRGMQSAALKVVKVKPEGPPWHNVVVDLRVEDHPEPLKELKRLWRTHQAYDFMNKGDEAMAEGHLREAERYYALARQRVPENPEIGFWTGITFYKNQKKSEARNILLPILSRQRWKELLKRLPDSGLLTSEEVEEILSWVP